MDDFLCGGLLHSKTSVKWRVNSATRALQELSEWSASGRIWLLTTTGCKMSVAVCCN
jgi:hypothetical protein